MNMLERERLESKKISKTQAVTSQLGHWMRAEDVHAGPSDYVRGWRIAMVLHPHGGNNFWKCSH